MAATGSPRPRSVLGRVMAGRHTFKVDLIHVGRDIELEKSRSATPEHSSSVLKVKPATEGCFSECGKRKFVSETKATGLAHLKSDLRTGGW